MYAAVRAHPDGESTAARLALTAAEYGYDGAVIRNHHDSQAAYDPEALRAAYGVDVVDGLEVAATAPGEATGPVHTQRDQTTVLAVHGGDPAVNRWAVEQPAVDVLAHPTAGEEHALDHVIARTAADNGVRIELSLAPVVRTEGGARVRGLRALKRAWKLIETYETPYVISTGATGHLDLRAPRELAAVGDVVGVPADRIREGLAEWGRLAERNRRRQSDAFVEPGVWRPDTS